MNKLSYRQEVGHWLKLTPSLVYSWHVVFSFHRDFMANMARGFHGYIQGGKRGATFFLIPILRVFNTHFRMRVMISSTPISVLGRCMHKIPEKVLKFSMSSDNAESTIGGLPTLKIVERQCMHACMHARRSIGRQNACIQCLIFRWLWRLYTIYRLSSNFDGI